jgi:hypothetical protein
MSLDEMTRRSWAKGAALIASQVSAVSRAETALGPLAWTLNEAAAALARRSISSEELTKLCLARIDTAGVRTTAAAQVFKDRVPAEDAEVTRRLKAAGVVLLGKLNLDEMAFAGTGTTGCFGPAHNPWNTDRITGGSSAGSVAAVATGLCFGSVGTDDGGMKKNQGHAPGRRVHQASYNAPARRVFSCRQGE